MNNLNKNSNGVSKLSEIRDAYITLVDFLKDVMFKKRILERPSYAELSKKLGFTYNFIKDKKNTLKYHYPEKKTFDDLYNRLVNKFKKSLIRIWDDVDDMFNKLYKIAFSTTLTSSLQDTNASIKRKFFDDIKTIITNYFPNIRIFDTDISRIFFSRPRALKDSHLKGNYKNRMLTLSMLFSFIYRTRSLTKNVLINKIRDVKIVNDITLRKLKHDIKAFIENFIFSNPYPIKYINDTYDIGALYFKPEYNLTLEVWMALSIGSKKPILLKVARRMLNYSTFGRLNRFGVKDKGNVYSWDGLINMTQYLMDLLPRETIVRLLPKIKKYIKIRHLHPIEPRTYHRSWYTESTIKFHVVILILRDLGLEILNLEPIKAEAFKKISVMERFTYERHHIFPNDKLSIDVNRLVLTMHRNHAKLEKNTNLILNLIQSRLQLTLDCPQYYKKRFTNWKKKWQQYLERRLYLIEYGIENFIVRYFTDNNGQNYIINRFFKNIPRGDIDTEIRTMIQHWIDKNRPIPILNKFIFKKLFGKPKKLITSGYINI